MGKLLLLITLLGDLSQDPMYREASNQTRRALLETPSIKEELQVFQDDAERRLYRYTGLTRDELVYGAYVYPLLIGKLSTKPFKNFKYETKNGITFRPEIEYKFVGLKESSCMLFLQKEF